MPSSSAVSVRPTLCERWSTNHHLNQGSARWRVFGWGVAAENGIDGSRFTSGWPRAVGR
jgi:hypothetical protein